MTLGKFNEALEGHGVRLTQEEIRRLVGMSKNQNQLVSTDEDDNDGMIDYKQLSKNMGLQRNALNLMHSTFNLEKSNGAANNMNNRLLTK